MLGAMRRPPRPLCSERRPRRAQISAEQLASLSHEFRTPLNGVLGMARLLEGTRLTAEQRAYAAAIRDSGEHLLTLVNDVLDFAKLGAGKVELHPARSTIERPAARRLRAALAPRPREGRRDRLGRAGATSARSAPTKARLRQILLNFAGNAVKFTEAGGVLIERRRAPRAAAACGSPSTTPGPASPPAQRERIFEAFAQADPAHAHLGGAGLGLAIARRLAQAMDGEVGVEPRPAGRRALLVRGGLPRRCRRPRPRRRWPAASVGVASPNPIVREAAARQIEACGGDAGRRRRPRGA